MCVKSANAVLWGQPEPPPPRLRRRRPAEPRPDTPPLLRRGGSPSPAAPRARQRDSRDRTPLARTSSTEVQNPKPLPVTAHDSQRRASRKITPIRTLEDTPTAAPKTDLEVQNSASIRQSDRGTNPFLDHYHVDIPPLPIKPVDLTPRENRTEANPDNTCNPRQLSYYKDTRRSSRDSLGSKIREATPFNALVPRKHRTSRYGSMIGDTVESWARSAAQQRSNKPLVFGGTYPIDEPTYSPREPTLPHKIKPNLPNEELTYQQKPKAGSCERSLASSKESVHIPKPRSHHSDALTKELIVDPETHRRVLRETIEKSVEKFEAMLALKGGDMGMRERSVRTFDIDEPLDPWREDDLLPKDDDARYYVSAPKTFDIDEPVSFI